MMSGALQESHYMRSETVMSRHRSDKSRAKQDLKAAKADKEFHARQLKGENRAIARQTATRAWKDAIQREQDAQKRIDKG
jgi:hypothetical protein